MMSLNELDDLAQHVGTRNLAKCVECGATPYRVVGDGLAVEVYDALDESWGLLEAFPSKAARERWERAKATREAYVPANGLAHLGGKPFSARVVRLEPYRGLKHSGMITVKETPNWRHVSSIRLADAAAAIRVLADDDATIIDTDGESLRRLLEPATPAGSREPQMPTMNADLTPNTHEEPMKQKKERSTPNAEPSTLNAQRPTLNAQRATPGDGEAQPSVPPETAVSSGQPPTGNGAILMLAPGELEEHPEALAFWPDSEQRREDIEAVCASVAEVGGIRDPLTVCRRGDGGWWVVDGCTRLEAARRAKLAAVPCLAMTIREDDIKDEVFMRNMTRTRFCSGMRVMRYLEKHMADVLETAKQNADAQKTGAMRGRRGQGQSRDRPWSPAAIAERLKVSDKDVYGGIELLRCRYENMTVRRTRDSRTLVEATEEEREGIEEAYRRVLEGMPLRRWLPAAKGHTATEGKAKAPTDWDSLQARTMTSLENIFRNWDHLPEIVQDGFLKDFRKTLPKAPADVLLVVRRIAALLPPVA